MPSVENGDLSPALRDTGPREEGSDACAPWHVRENSEEKTAESQLHSEIPDAHCQASSLSLSEANGYSQAQGIGAEEEPLAHPEKQSAQRSKQPESRKRAREGEAKGRVEEEAASFLEAPVEDILSGGGLLDRPSESDGEGGQASDCEAPLFLTGGKGSSQDKRRQRRIRARRDPDTESSQERGGTCWCPGCLWELWQGCCGGRGGEAEREAMSGPAGAASAMGAPSVGFWGPGSLPRAVGLIFAWYFFSMGLSLYNKILIGEKFHFPAPLLMTTFHFLLQFFISSFLINCVCTSWAPTVRMTCRDYNLRIIPTALATALDIGLSNLSLAFITLTFYTMCKSSAPVFLLLFAFVFRLEEMSLRLLGVMCVISIGVLFTVAGETHFHLLGFLLVLGSSITSGLRWVLIQVLLQKDRLGLTNPLVTMAYLTPIMALLCAVFSLLHEPWHVLHKTVFFDTWEHAAWSMVVMTLGGLLAFFMILSEFLLVLETSAVTFSVAGTVKEGATILVSHLVFGDRFTRVNLIGIFVILLGVSLFNMYRQSHSSHGPSTPRPLPVDGNGSDERLLLLSPQTPTAPSSQLQNPAGTPRGIGPHAMPPQGPSSAHDQATVIVATATEPQLQPQRSITSPIGSNSESPTRSVTAVELVPASRPAGLSGSQEKRIPVQIDHHDDIHNE